MTEQGKLYDDLISNGVTTMGEDSSRAFSECEMMHCRRVPFKQTSAYEADILFALSPYFMKFYNSLGDIYSIFSDKS